MYYYKQVKDEQIVSVEAKSKPALSQDFVEATKAEYDTFIASLPAIEPEPPPSFIPQNLALGIEQRVSHIEAFLKQIYPEVRQ